MPKSRELSLKDGRTFWTTKNGFQKHLRDTNGNETHITDEYYTKLIGLWRKENSRKAKQKTNG